MNENDTDTSNLKKKPLQLNRSQSARVFVDTMDMWMEIYHLTEDDDFGKVGDWVFVPVGIFRERDTRGNWIALKRKSYYTFKKGYVPTKKHLAKICRSLLLQMLEHELDEGLWIDGERVFDPHRNGEP